MSTGALQFWFEFGSTYTLSLSKGLSRVVR